MNNQNARALLNGKAFFRVAFLVAVIALVLVLVNEILRAAVVVEAFLKRKRFGMSTRSGPFMRFLRNVETDT